MSLAQALALVSARKAQRAGTPAGSQKRNRAIDQHDPTGALIDEAMEQVDEVAVVNVPNITIYGGDYHGNILGCRICPPLTKPDTKNQDIAGDEDIDNDNEDDVSKHKAQNNSRISVLARALAREKGIDPALLEQKRQLKYAINLRPVVSGELHAGSVGSIAAFNRYVVTAGLQDENIKLSKRDVDQSVNKLKEFGSLHRHDSTITTTVFTPSNHGQLCLSGSENGIIYVWSTLNQWDCIGVLKSHTARIVAIAPHPTANMALSLSIDNKLIMWDLRPESFRSVFITQLRSVKPSWGTQPLPPMNMIFSPDGNFYSVLYNRCVHTYHTTGEHAGKIMSIIDIPQDITTLWSSMQYLDTAHLILGNEKGEMYIYNVISTTNILHLTGQHKHRVKHIAIIPHVHTTWMDQYTTPLFETPTKTTDPATTQSTKKQKANTQTLQSPTTEPVETTFIVSADSDGKIVLWQIEVKTTGSETVLIQPKSSAKRDDDDDDNDKGDLYGSNDFDNIDDDDNTQTKKPKFSYPLITCTSLGQAKALCHLTTNTRITCLCIALPFDSKNLNPLGNQYKQMGHVMETINESKTQYEDATDKIYSKQYQDYAKKFKQQKVDDFKLKVRDYHRMKAGKIKDLSEGDAVKKGSNPTGEKIKGFGKEKYRKLDEEFQKEHQKKQLEKTQGNKKTADGQNKKRLTRLESKVAKRANPALAGTLRARKRNGGKKGPTTRGKRRF